MTFLLHEAGMSKSPRKHARQLCSVSQRGNPLSSPTHLVMVQRSDSWPSGFYSAGVSMRNTPKRLTC